MNTTMYHTHLVGQKGLMSSQEHIVEAQESTEDVVVHDRARAVTEEVLVFPLVNVEAHGGNVPVLQVMDQCIRLDEPTSRCIDDDNALLCQREGFVVEQVTCGVHEWAVKRDDICLLEQVRQFGDVSDPCFLRIHFIRVGVKGQNVATESSRQNATLYKHYVQLTSHCVEENLL